VSDDSEAVEDSNIFNDDNEEAKQTGEMAPTQLGNAIPTITVRPKPVPPANNSQGSKKGNMATSKGKERGDKKKGEMMSKGKGVEKVSKHSEGIVELKKTQTGDSKDIDADGKDKEGELTTHQSCKEHHH
jgi:hypothetical protein